MSLVRSRRLWLPAFVALAGVALVAAWLPLKAEQSSADWLKDIQTGKAPLKSISGLNFGPGGVLLVADPQSAAFLAIDTGDAGPVAPLSKKVENINGKIAELLGAPADGVQIADMAVNPASGKTYLAVSRKADNQPALVVVNGAGELKLFPLDNVRYVRVPLKGSESTKIGNISDLEFAQDRVLVAAQSNEEFSSKIYSVPLPLTHDGAGNMFSTETYHVAHGRWETKAPIQSFIPFQEDGKSYLVGAFACTPIVKFPVDDVQAGANVKGTSVVELGSGNRPLDMFTYEKDGHKWLITNTYRFHFMKSKFGPSKWWGVRVNMAYLDAQDVNEKAARRNVAEKSGPDGIEIVDALFGAVQVAQLDNDQIVVLRANAANDSEDKLSLEPDRLP